jgi:hypothetical protein
MATDLQRPRRRRSGSAARWCAVLVFGFAVGAALVLLTDSDPDASVVSAGPTVTSNGTSTAVDATAAAPAAATAGGIADVNGAHVHGVKAQDVAAESQADQPLDAPTRDLLAEQLTTARDHAMQFPTVADATAAGYRLAGGFAPGSGAHYIGGPMTGGGPFDPNAVQSLIYDGTSPASKIVGLMYYSIGADAPDGFAGPNDHWHRHSHVCTKFTSAGIDVPFPADADVSKEQCTSVGGFYMSITGYMVHAWVVPSWESPQGVFSHENPNVRCADGTYDTQANGMCQGT